MKDFYIRVNLTKYLNQFQDWYARNEPIKKLFKWVKGKIWQR